MAPSVIDSGRIDERPTPERRRRTIVVLAMFCVLLAIASSIVGYLNRPLTDAEQRLVGTWRNTTSPAVFTFHYDKTVTSPGLPRGRWSMRDNRLHTRDSLLEDALLSLLHPRSDRSIQLTFKDDNNIWVFAPQGGTIHQWQRVAPPSLATPDQ